ncbi:hypothetical protein [Streptomyces bacillaris]|uniref:hypothetical protein n=1 Tax=Streptomyces bacillaris TaxID=68179 RepID=UPI003EB787FC
MAGVVWYSWASRRGNPEVDCGALGAAVGVLALGAQELEGEVEPFDLSAPGFGLRAYATTDEIGFEVVKPTEHLRAHLEHGASNAGGFVLAGGAVGAPACAEFALALVEVIVELIPLVAADVAVLVVGAELAPFVEVGEVVAYDVFVE